MEMSQVPPVEAESTPAVPRAEKRWVKNLANYTILTLKPHTAENSLEVLAGGEVGDLRRNIIFVSDL